jgi:hypothetical protein
MVVVGVAYGARTIITVTTTASTTVVVVSATLGLPKTNLPWV